jgi:hypothetical protein
VIEYLEVDNEEDFGDSYDEIGSNFSGDRQGFSRSRIDLSGNTKVVGPFFSNYTKADHFKIPISVVWIAETERPWRRGWGLALSFGKHCFSLGFWKMRTGPNRWLQLAAEDISDW